MQPHQVLAALEVQLAEHATAPTAASGEQLEAVLAGLGDKASRVRADDLHKLLLQERGEPDAITRGGRECARCRTRKTAATTAPRHPLPRMAKPKATLQLQPRAR